MGFLHYFFDKIESKEELLHCTSGYNNKLRQTDGQTGILWCIGTNNQYNCTSVFFFKNYSL
jgi:hypothetical protein